MTDPNIRDKYDLDEEKLMQYAGTERWQEEVHKHWGMASPLFMFVGSGCLTMIRKNSKLYKGYTAAITAQVVADERLPAEVRNILPEHLPIFKEWQRRMDVEFPGRHGDGLDDIDIQ